MLSLHRPAGLSSPFIPCILSSVPSCPSLLFPCHDPEGQTPSADCGGQICQVPHGLSLIHSEQPKRALDMSAFIPEHLKPVHKCTDTIHKLTAFTLEIVNFPSLSNSCFSWLIVINSLLHWKECCLKYSPSGSNRCSHSEKCKFHPPAMQPVFNLPHPSRWTRFRWPLMQTDRTPSLPRWCDRHKRSGADYAEDDEERISTCQVGSAKLSLQPQCSNLPPAEGIYVSTRVRHLHICRHAIFPTAYSRRDHPVWKSGVLII